MPDPATEVPVLIVGEIVSCFLILALYLAGTGHGGEFLVHFAATGAILMLLLFHFSIQRDDFFLSVSVLGFGLLYVTFLLGHLLLLRTLENGPRLIFYLAMVTWGTDSGALFAGKSFGRRKLAPTISPNKTWEGAIGGLLLGTLFAVVAQKWFLPFMTLREAVGVALVLGVAGEAGDLVASAFKRANQIKDSGSWIPGHGGILDKIDSFLFTGPILYYYLYYQSVFH